MSKKTKTASTPRPIEKPEHPMNAKAASIDQPEVDNSWGGTQEATEDVKAKTNADANDGLIEGIEHLKKVAGAIHLAHSMMKRAKEVFNMYPELPECYFTSDETAFTERQHAFMHAQNLQVSEVFTIKKSEV